MINRKEIMDFSDGNTSRSIIEPYSLRLTREGNLLLYAVKHDTTEERSYRVDRIQGAEVTKILDFGQNDRPLSATIKFSISSFFLSMRVLPLMF